MKETTRSALVAGLAVLAVALAAATLESTVVPERGPAGESAGGGGPAPMPASEPAPAPGETIAIPYLSEILTVLAAIAVLACLAYAIVHRRRALAIGLGIVALLGLAFLLFRYVSLPAEFGEQPRTARNDSLPVGSGNGSADGGTGASGPGQWPIVLFVLGLAVVGAVVALVRTAGDGGDVSGGAADESESGDAAAVGRAAGRAADRLEGEGESESEADTENEVYRAWLEMTELLDVDEPETSTPGEFAAAAVEAGLGRDDVDELTRLFEDVRYGDAAPSDEAERRAIEIFRRIEDRYAGGAS